MKHFFFTLLLFLHIPIVATAQEAYAVYTTDGTLTFYYDNQKSSRSGTKYALNTGTSLPGWYGHSKDIKKAVFTSSFSEARPTSTFSWFRSCINLTSITGMENLNTANVTNMSIMFNFCSSLTSLDVSHFNTANVTSMRNIFYNCSSLTSLDVSNFNTAKVTDMHAMFSGCSSLTSLDVSNFNTANVTDMSSMFQSCYSLTSLDLSNFNTGNVEFIFGMFSGCSSLTSLDVSNFNTAKVTDMYAMFSGCSSLTTIYVDEAKWKVTKGTSGNYMFEDCTCLVGGAGTRYDANHIDKAYAHIDGGQSNPGYLTGKSITSSMNLQEFIDANAGVSGVVDVDLSMFENDLVREQTLTVSTGASYRFINGTMDRAESNSNPVMLISQGSKVEISDGAVVTGRGNWANGCETIRMEGGTLNITQGVAEGSLGYPPYSVGNPSQSNAVKLTSPNDHFHLLHGEIYGSITCTAEGADIDLDGGQIMGYGLREISQNASQNSPRRASPMGSRSPRIVTHSDIHLNATTSKDFTWGYVVIVPGGNSEESQLDPFKITLYPTSKLCLKKHYDAGFVFHIHDKQEGDVVAIGDGYTLTDADLQLMSIESNTIYYTSGPPYTDDREPYLELEDNKVYLRYKTEVVCDADDLLRYIESLTGTTTTNDDPAEATLCDEPTIDQDVDIEDDLWLYLYGDDDITPPVMNFYGGAINLKSRNSGWTFKGVGFTSNAGATAPLRAAGEPGGITSIGTLTFDGCTLKEGNYAVQNLSDGRMYLSGGTVVEGHGNLISSGNVYIDGSVKVADLVNKKGGRIYVTSALTKDLKVSIATTADVEQGVAIILGGNGYTMTAADVSHITLSLPNGFEWKYNEAAGGIVVSTASGITAPHSTHPVAVDSYTIKGHKVPASHQGITIQRMSDGTVIKIYSPK